MSRSTSASYAMRGTYPDGVVRHLHTSTSDIHRTATERLVGLLPFAVVEVRACHGGFNCNCHDTWDDRRGVSVYRLPVRKGA